jgi:hypothetical protein
MHILISPKFFYILYSVATPRHLRPLLLGNHVYIVALALNLQRAFFYSVIEYFYHSSTNEPILSLILYKGVLSEL